jgi:hypothetical protein
MHVYHDNLRPGSIFQVKQIVYIKGLEDLFAQTDLSQDIPLPFDYTSNDPLVLTLTGSYLTPPADWLSEGLNTGEQVNRLSSLKASAMSANVILSAHECPSRLSCLHKLTSHKIYHLIIPQMIL